MTRMVNSILAKGADARVSIHLFIAETSSERCPSPTSFSRVDAATTIVRNQSISPNMPDASVGTVPDDSTQYAKPNEQLEENVESVCLHYGVSKSRCPRIFVSEEIPRETCRRHFNVHPQLLQHLNLIKSAEKSISSAANCILISQRMDSSCWTRTLFLYNS